MTQRNDDFLDAVKRSLALRVGNICSRPDCQASTAGPHNDPAKAVNVGVAAHITAASPGGPRYNPELSPEERSSPNNGIWLCQNCAKLADNDVARFTVTLLKSWKHEAELKANTLLGKTAISNQVTTSGQGVMKPNIAMNGYQYLWLKINENHVWHDSSGGRKALLFCFINNPCSHGKGMDVFSVRAQVMFEWDTGVSGPSFSPAPWLGEELSFVDIPVGVEKKLIVGIGLGPQQGWYGYKSNRIRSDWARGVNPLEGNPIPDFGKMRVRVIASIDSKSEVIWMSCFSWEVAWNTNHPRFAEVPCRELQVA